MIYSSLLDNYVKLSYFSCAHLALREQIVNKGLCSVIQKCSYSTFILRTVILSTQSLIFEGKG